MWPKDIRDEWKQQQCLLNKVIPSSFVPWPSCSGVASPSFRIELEKNTYNNIKSNFAYNLTWKSKVIYYMWFSSAANSELCSAILFKCTSLYLKSWNLTKFLKLDEYCTAAESWSRTAGVMKNAKGIFSLIIQETGHKMWTCNKGYNWWSEGDTTKEIWFHIW